MRKVTLWIGTLSLLAWSSWASCPGMAGARFHWQVIAPCSWNGSTTFVDERDGRRYRQVQIGQQCWMAENLDFGEQVQNLAMSDNQKAEKSCLNNEGGSCAELGGLYTWEEARNYAELPDKKEYFCGICPSGWHLPSDSEWQLLESNLEPSLSPKEEGWRGEKLAKLLMGEGFQALPGGTMIGSWNFYEQRRGFFWTATPYSQAAAWIRSIGSDTPQVFRGAGDKLLGYSIRCVKD